jgi:NTE family protein
MEPGHLIDLHHRAVGTSLPRPVAFVLSGGGALGAVHIGMLRALVEAGITPDLVVGSSVGAINGAMIAAQPVDAAALLRRVWERLDRGPRRQGSALRPLAEALQMRRSLHAANGLARLVRQHRPADTIGELELPFAAVATDARSGRPVVLRDGDLCGALMASTALPGVYPRVRLNDTLLVDGSLSAPVPVRQALALGARSLVVLDAGCDDAALTSPVPDSGSLSEVTRLLIRQRIRDDLRQVPDEVTIVYPPSPTDPGVTSTDFSRTNELIRRGYHSTQRFLDTLVLTGPGLYGGPNDVPREASIDLDADLGTNDDEGGQSALSRESVVG